MTDEFVIEIEDAQSEFVRVADLDGRNVVIFPIKLDKAKGDDPYPFLVCDVIVLDGPATELMEEIPYVVRKSQLTSAPMIRNGERMIEKANRANLAHPNPYAGKINSRKGQKGGRAYGIETWEKDAPIRKLANDQVALYLKARESGVSDAEAFE